MDSAGQTQGTNRSYAGEGVKEDTGGFQIGQSEECGSRGQIEAGGSVGYSEEAALNWKQRVEEMSTNRVKRSTMERFQEDAPEEDSGRDGAVSLIISILSNSNIQN